MDPTQPEAGAPQPPVLEYYGPRPDLPAVPDTPSGCSPRRTVLTAGLMTFAWGLGLTIVERNAVWVTLMVAGTLLIGIVVPIREDDAPRDPPHPRP